MKHRRKQKRGATLLELAMVLTVMFTVLVATIDMGRFAYFYIATGSAAGAAARFASFHPVTSATQTNWNNQTRQAAINDIQGIAGYDVNRLTVANPVVTTDAAPFFFRRVRVSVTYQFTTLISWPGIPSTINLVRAVEMRMVR